MNTDGIPISSDELAELCRKESSKKYPRHRNDHYCYELLKRAFAHADEYALGLILDIYKQIWSKFWIRNAQSFETRAITADDFKSIAFIKVYKETKGERFASFTSLNPFLSYLYKTLVRTIAEYLRSADARATINRPEQTDDSDDTLERIAAPSDPKAEVERKLIWQKIEERVAALLPEEELRILFDCWSNQGLSRAEIVIAYRRFWAKEDDVRKALQRIKRRLYKDALFLSLLRDLRN